MAQHGGSRPVRTNSTPKPVSGPGKLSQRTDMVPSGGAYGDRKAIVQQMQGAPMAKNPQPTQSLPQLPMPSPKPVTDLFAPTTRPNEPVTAGSPLGPGPGPEVLNLPNRQVNIADTFTRLAQNDPTGEIESILNDMRSRGIE